MAENKWASKIRPLSLLFLTLFVAFLAIADGNMHWDDLHFTVAKEYISLFQSLLFLAYSFYFGGRSLEKIANIKKEADNKKS